MELTSHSKKSWAWVWVGAVVVVAGLLAGGWWFLRQADGYSGLREQLLAQRTSFVLMYPEPIPSELKIIGDSVEVHEDAVMFGLNKGEDRVTITQQAKPKFMEEVDKIQDVAVPAGKAYIAKLNERTVGFLVTDTTLVIVSAAQPLDADTITAILGSLKAL